MNIEKETRHEIKATLLNNEETKKINMFLDELNNLKKLYKPPKIIKSSIFKNLPKTSNDKLKEKKILKGGTLFNNNFRDTMAAILAAKQPNQTLILVLGNTNPADIGQGKIELANGLRVMLHYFCYTTANAVIKRKYGFVPMFNGMPTPFDELYNSNESKLMPYTHITAPDEIINGIHFYNTTPDPAFPHLHFSLHDMLFAENAIIPNEINIVVTLQTANAIDIELIPTPLEIQKNQCFTHYWDHVINPWHYLQQNIPQYSQDARILHYITAQGEQELSQNNCRSVPGNPPLIGNIPNLIAEVQKKELEYDNLLLNKCNLTNINGEIIWGPDRPNILWRGMKQPYNNINPNGSYQLLNYLHTTINVNVAINFATGGANSILYRIHLSPGIPYFSFDNNPYTSHYGLAEEEIIFMRGLIAIPVGIAQIEPAVHAVFPVQNIQLVCPPNLLTTINYNHSLNTTNGITTIAGRLTGNAMFNDVIATQFGSPVAQFHGGSKRKTKKSFKKRNRLFTR